MRLIDADELIKNYGLENATKYGNKDAEQQAHSYSTLMLYEIATMIEDAPTVEPVRGEWIPDERGTHFCSVCDSEAYWDTDYGQELFDWCPYCGADMRGEKND